MRTQAAMGDTAAPGYSLAQLAGARALRKQLIVGVVVQLSMQLSGIDAIHLYSTLSLRMAGVADPQLATTLLGATNVVMTAVAIAVMDKLGRRRLLLAGWAGMCASYAVLTVAIVAGRHADEPAAGGFHTLAVAAMMGVVVFFSIGPGCVAWFVIAEIFPTHARDAAMALGVGLNWLANWLVAFSFPLAQYLLGPYTFVLFVASTAAFGAFTYAFVPETKGRSLREVTASFDSLSTSPLQ